MSKIYVIMGKSSTGKDTVFKKLMENKKIKTVTIYTTRPMRDGECNGREYFFTDEGHLKEFEKQGKIIELRIYNTVYGEWKYFTLDDGQIDLSKDERYLVIGTLEAYNKFKEYYGKEAVVPIYIEVDDRTRIHRAIEREEAQDVPKYSEMCRRFLADEQDFSDEKILEAEITKRYANYDLNSCVADILKDML